MRRPNLDEFASQHRVKSVQVRFHQDLSSEESAHAMSNNRDALESLCTVFSVEIVQYPSANAGNIELALGHIGRIVDFADLDIVEPVVTTNQRRKRRERGLVTIPPVEEDDQ